LEASFEPASGWWISANIGKEDFEPGIRAACQASDLVYGSDIRFPGNL